MTKHRPSAPIHPGKILRIEFMELHGLSAYALAKALSVPAPRVNDIVRERRGISTKMGLLLSAYFGLSQDFWTNLQGEYERRVAAPRLARQLARIRPVAALTPAARIVRRRTARCIIGRGAGLEQ